MHSEKLEKARAYEKREAARVPEFQRPAFHMSVPIGWMNDPNGFSSYKGDYHLFFQYNPYGTHWDTMHWGHVRSKDLVTWEYLPAALAPDEPYDEAGVFSGTAMEADGKHILMYTGVTEHMGPDGKKVIRQNQCIAVGDGENYVKLSANPVITGDMLPAGCSREDFRDPKIWMENGVFYAAAANRAEDGSGQIALFTSGDGEKWSFHSMLDKCENRLGRMWECPDFFPLDGRQVLLLSPQDMMAQGLEFHGGNNAAFLLGDYDRETCRFSGETVQSADYGLDFYAPQTLEAPDGRRILIGWMKSWDADLLLDGFRWNGMMTFPRELTLREGRIFQNPVEEIWKYYGKEIVYRHVELQGQREFEGISGRTLDLTVEAEAGSYEAFRIFVAKNERFETVISYDPGTSVLTFDRTGCGVRRDCACLRRIAVRKQEGRLKLRILLDKYSAEIFVNDGESVLTSLVPTPLEADRIVFETEGKAEVSMTCYEVRKSESR